MSVAPQTDPIAAPRVRVSYFHGSNDIKLTLACTRCVAHPSLLACSADWGEVYAVGLALRNPADRPDKARGRQIATSRALDLAAGFDLWAEHPGKFDIYDLKPARALVYGLKKLKTLLRYLRFEESFEKTSARAFMDVYKGKVTLPDGWV